MLKRKIGKQFCISLGIIFFAMLLSCMSVAERERIAAEEEMRRNEKTNRI